MTPVRPTIFVLSICIALSAAAAAALAADGLQWIAAPELSGSAVGELAAVDDLRGTYDGLTLAVGDAETLARIRRHSPRARALADYRASERLLWIYVGERPDWRPPDGVRLLERWRQRALIGLPHDLRIDLHRIAPHVAGLLHDGVVPVATRRQRPQPEPPAGLLERAAVFDGNIQDWVDQVDQANLLADVTTLSTQFENRTSNTSEGEAAQDWLVDRFSALGMQVGTHSFDSNADNVVAEIPGTVTPERVVIVGAHYDSINFFFGSNAPGADDNASGTAALLEIARILTEANAEFENTLRFIAFASEEFGLIGSDAYSQLMVQQGTDVIAMLNTDMNAYRASGDTRDLDMVENNTTPWLNDLLIEISELYQPDFPTRKGSLFSGTSDHQPFFNDGFPAAFYFEDTGQFSPFIHTGNDQLGNSANDFTLSEQIVKSILAGAAVLADPVSLVPGPELTISGFCPGSITLDVTGLTPAGQFGILTADSMGSFLVPAGSCVGTPMDLDDPTPQGLFDADASGNFSLTLEAPANVCGTLVQLLDVETCEASGIGTI